MTTLLRRRPRRSLRYSVGPTLKRSGTTPDAKLVQAKKDDKLKGADLKRKQLVDGRTKANIETEASQCRRVQQGSSKGLKPTTVAKPGENWRLNERVATHGAEEKQGSQGAVDRREGRQNKPLSPSDISYLNGKLKIQVCPPPRKTLYQTIIINNNITVNNINVLVNGGNVSGGLGVFGAFVAILGAFDAGNCVPSGMDYGGPFAYCCDCSSDGDIDVASNDAPGYLAAVDPGSSYCGCPTVGTQPPVSPRPLGRPHGRNRGRKWERRHVNRRSKWRRFSSRFVACLWGRRRRGDPRGRARVGRARSSAGVATTGQTPCRISATIQPISGRDRSVGFRPPTRNSLGRNRFSPPATRSCGWKRHARQSRSFAPIRHAGLVGRLGLVAWPVPTRRLDDPLSFRNRTRFVH